MRYLLFLPALLFLQVMTANPSASVKYISDKDTFPNDILFTDRDTTIDPSADFFMYANGGWIKNNPIPADQSSWGIGNAVQEELYNRLKAINIKSLPATDGMEKKVGDFWYSAMDTPHIEQQKLIILQPELDAINTIKDIKALQKVAADMQIKGIDVLYRSGAGQDDKNSSVMAYFLSQGGLGLPNRDYYFNTDTRTANIRKAYIQYVANVYQSLGATEGQAVKKAAALMQLETRLAKASRKLADLRDPYKNYNKFAISDLNKITPAINWSNIFHQKDVQHIDSVIVGQPEFYKALNTALKEVPLTVWKDYLRFHLIRSLAPYLNDATYNSYFAFYGTALRGIPQPKPRWKRMLDVEDNLLGEALGKVFVKEYFPEAAKKRYSDLVENIRTALHDRIEKLDWMSDSTKQKALHKLAVMNKKVGYPNQWKDYSDMQIDRSSLVRNVINANTWKHYYNVHKLGKPVDREEWHMNPQTYNAYYNPSNNEIVLPAGIFTVPGYRDNELNDALVYGYAGASTIGHEITHGFDDEGRQFDENGNLHAWWSPKDSAEFTERAEVMVQQFNNYIVVDSMHINGKATLGENIADLGGVLLGLDAFKKTDTYKSGTLINGMTPLQRYFLGYALGWLGHQRKEELATRLLTDVHSPAQWRVIGPFANVPEFYDAFHIKPGSSMYRPDSLRVRIW